jgi:hypothetical protein
MSRITKISCLIFFLTILSIGCGPKIPTAERPAEIQRTFQASTEKVWDSVSEVIRITGGTILTKDKSSGLITYSTIAKEYQFPIYLNVYIKSAVAANTTIVYLIPKTRGGAYFEEIENDFFNKLDNNLGGAIK